MRFGWAAFEFGVELAGHKEAASRILNNLNKIEFAVDTRHNQSGLLNGLAVAVVELVTVTVALNNMFGTVGFGGERAGNNIAIVVAKTQRSAHIHNVLLFLH